MKKFFALYMRSGNVDDQTKQGVEYRYKYFFTSV